MTTAIVPRAQIDEYASLIRSLVGLPDNVPDAVVQATAQLAIRYNLDAFTKEIQIIPLGNTKVTVMDDNGRPVEKWVPRYAPYVGVNGLMRSARRASTFDTKPRAMSPEEVREMRGEEYDPLDVGVEVTLWRHDVEERVRKMGRDYNPVVAYGFWRKKVREVDRWEEGPNGQKRKVRMWESDPLPNTMTRQQKAEQRAMRNAIRLAYDLNLPEGVADDDSLNNGTAMAFYDEEPPVDAVIVEVDERSAKLLEAGYRPAQLAKMDDESQENAVAHEERAAESAALPPEELRERFEKNKKEMRGRRTAMSDLGAVPQEPDDLLPPESLTPPPTPDVSLTKGVIPSDPKAWQKVKEALDWAVEQGAYDTVDHAKTMFLGVNSLASRDLQGQFQTWYDHCVKVLAARTPEAPPA